LQEDFVVNNELAPITRLAIQYVTSGYDEDKGWIEVGTSQMVDKDYIQKYIATAPESELSFVVNPYSFRIEGNFTANDIVDLTVKQGLPGLYGGSLLETYQASVPMANLEPSISWEDDQGRYMMMSGHKNLVINAVNIPEAEVQVFKVFRNNLVFYLNNTDYMNDEDYDEDYEDEGEYMAPPDDESADVENNGLQDYGSSGNEYGKLLYKDKLKLSDQENRMQKYTINLQKALGGKFKGIYGVRVNSSTDRWLGASKFIAISDLGIICKRSENDVLVWVNSISTTDAVEDVTAKLISSNNQTLMQGTTDGSGMIRFANAKDAIGDFKLRLLTAEKGDDFNYLDLKETYIETSRFDVGGKQTPVTGYDAFVYSERNLYRPGETMNLSAIVRTTDIKALSGMPLILKIIAPNGKSIEEWRKNTNQEGSLEWPFQIPQYATTGQYVTEVYSGNEKLIGSYRFNVEEFAPDKIRVDLKPGQQKLTPGSQLTANVSAQYLFGAPASGSRYESDIYFSQESYTSKRYPDYDFSGNNTYGTYLENQVSDGNLDASGKTTVTWPVPANLQSNGIVKATDLISVFDETGRSVSRSTTFNIYPKSYFIGINQNDYYFSTGQDIPVKIAAVDANDNNLSNFPLEMELVRYEWENVLMRNYNDRYYYSPQKKEIHEWVRRYTMNGTMTLPIRVMAGGEYEIRMRKAGDSAYVSHDFYAWGYSENNFSSYEVDREGNINMVPDKEVYKTGENAKILFSTPFSGKMLVTVERDKIFYNTYVDVKNNAAQLELPIGADYKPNVYVSATLFKKHGENQTTPLLVAHGWVNLKIEQPDDKINVKIEAPKKVKPNTTQTIVINTIPQKDVYVTLAAVDEGILQIKNYQTPDPYKAFYAKRQLDVVSYDMYKFLLEEVAGHNSSTGGDMAFEMNKKRSMPFMADRFKLLSYWSGIRRSDASGRASISMPVPQFNGEVRLMAVAYTGDKFGSAELPMTVTDDVVLLPSVPRFLSQNDLLNLPVTVMNTTNRSGSVTVKFNLQGPMNGTSAMEQTVNVPAHGQGQVNFSLKTDLRVGTGKISFSTSGLASVHENIDIAVRPNSPFTQDGGSGVVRAGQTISVKLPGDFVQGTQNFTFTVAKFPALQNAKYLKDLLGYPYGCLEQTVSKAFPQMYFEDIARMAAPEMYRNNNPAFYTNEAIRKVEAMQLYDGSISYWPGGGYANYWTNVFAAHFLVEARKAGYAVNKDKLDKLLDFIHRKAMEKGTYKYAYYSGNQLVFTKKAFKENLYTLYVLALAGKPDQALMNYYRSRPELITRDMQYMLAGAYGLSRDWQSFNVLLPRTFESENAARDNWEDFDSEIRSNAIMLDVLMDIDPNNSQVPMIVKYLSAHADEMYSTQDLCWGFLALGKAAKANGNSNVILTANASGQHVLSYSGNPVTVSNSTLAGKSVTLTATGSGQVYYYWGAEGIKLNNPVKEEDVNLKVRRTYYDRNGNEITNNTFTQGQLIVCKISLMAGTQSITNVAISDLVPAGFEIMNPRITSLSELSWLQGQSNADYLDIRDDRILYFTSAYARNTETFYYMLRAVNTGTFQLPAIGAEAMYDPNYHSYNGAGTVKIIGHGTGGV
jgi:hypothetical protein